MSTSPITRLRRLWAGLTLIEIIVAVSVLTIVLSIGLGGVAQSARTTNKLTNLDHMRRQAYTALDQVSGQLLATEANQLATYDVTSGGNPADEIEFSLNEGFDASTETISYGTLKFFTREGTSLVMITDDDASGDISSGDTRIALCGDVSSFDVTPISDGGLVGGAATTGAHFGELDTPESELTITMTLEKQIGVHTDGTAWTVSVTVERSIYIRNSED